jgi:hypothetical protein
LLVPLTIGKEYMTRAISHVQRSLAVQVSFLGSLVLETFPTFERRSDVA